MKIFHSIRWRLQFWYGLLLALILAGFGITAQELERAQLNRTVDSELQKRLAVIAAELQPNRPRPRRPPPPEDAPPPPDDDLFGPGPEGPPQERAISLKPEEAALFDSDPNTGYYYVLWHGKGPPFATSKGAPSNAPKPNTSGTGARSRDAVREAFLVTLPGDTFVVGRHMSADLAGLRRRGWLLVGAGTGILALGLLVGNWLVRRSLRPIQDISSAAAKIAGGDLSQRINSSDAESELGQLAAVLNSTFKRLEASFTQQGRFTADAAHELRTPVTVILTHTQNALATGCAVDEHRDAFEACQRAAQRMRRLVESLLQLARLDAGQEPMRLADFDLAELARECIELVSPLAAEKQLRIETRLGSCVCRGDAQRLEQVVGNLLSNAIHHNRSGGEVVVETRQVAGRAILTVADNGPGIAAEHVHNIFERFYRADKARSNHSGQTGLGLAIAKAIVEAHGGSIEVRSAPGEGAHFTVELPAG